MSTEPAFMPKARKALASVYGFSAFRPGQEEILTAVLDGKDVLAVMPTGSGKSLCFQLPPIVREGLTLVVSPLIALMRDQVAQLRELGVEAGSVNSSTRSRSAAGSRGASGSGRCACFTFRLRDCCATTYAPTCAMRRSIASPSTKPIASRNGVTTSGPNIYGCGAPSRRSATFRLSP